MHVIAIHSISDPDRFWAGNLDIPEGTSLQTVCPNPDGTKAICIWEADSVDAVRQLVDGAAGEFSNNEFFEVNETNAQGLPG
jgi:hypothetical protein